MESASVDFATRVKTLHAVLTRKDEAQAVESALRAAGGDWVKAQSSLKKQLSPSALSTVTLAHALADLTNDNARVVTALMAQKGIASLRDVALSFDVDRLAAILHPQAVPESIPGHTAEAKAKNYAVTLHDRLFAVATSAVLQRMVRDVEVPVADAKVRSGVVTYLSNQPGFDIRTTSIYASLKHPDAFRDIAEAQRPAVIEQLKTLQRVQAISPVAAAVPALIKANVTSAFRATELTEQAFMSTFSETLGEAAARQVYTNAVDVHVRNEQALTTMRQAVRGTGLALIDGERSRESRLADLQTLTDQKGVPLNLSTLFGSLDSCECDDCLSVYSPAAYFVELLQFLRNNDLGPDPASGDPDPTHNKNIHPGIVGTPVEKLFRRRPDLGCLQLTCENTFTVLPYIDLVNEVMESFVVHVADYHKDTHDPKQVTLETFNVDGETTGELLATPQHVNYLAYCILKSAVYPFTLPYHQPIDATRIFLEYMGTSRWELLDRFRTPTESCPGVVLTPAELKELQGLHQAVIDRAVDADYLDMTQEEYIILTHQAFWPKRYFDLTQSTVFTQPDYEQKIGVRDVWEYYGYAAGGAGKALMLSLDEDPKTGGKGLTFVKKQFLPRTGIAYADLVELLKTRFVNPNFPEGHALTVLESIRASYRFLQTLVDGSSADPTVRYAKVIDFLNKWQALVPLLDAILHPDMCRKQGPYRCFNDTDFASWVYCYFERIGKLIVLESGQGPELVVTIRIALGRTAISATQPLEGTVVDALTGALLGHLRRDGVITDKSGALLARVSADLSVFGADGAPVIGPWGIKVTVQGGELGVAVIQQGRLAGIPPYTAVAWTAVRDTCELDPVRLRHLDGTALEVSEYDRIQRFIRLWRKLGWTIDEVDKALAGLDASSAVAPAGAPAGGGPVVPAGGAGGGAPAGGAGPVCEFIDFDEFVDDCSDAAKAGRSCCTDDPNQQREPQDAPSCPAPIVIDANIQPLFLHQLRAVQQLLERTGLPLPKLLAFWADISTRGEHSLYATLFLTHNLTSLDDVFQPDANGNYLTQPATITDHLPVLMAAFKLKADDLTAIMTFAKIADSLTLPNVSILYRYSLLAKLLHVRVPQLADVVSLFGDPFKSAWATLDLLDTWGDMEDAGFTFRQLDYLFLDQDDPQRPLGPSQKLTLQLAKTLYDGLNAIDRDHPDIAPGHEADATVELVRAKLALIFETDVVEKIVSVLEGTTVYTTNAPTGLTITPAPGDTLNTKLAYHDDPAALPPTAALQVTGILTAPEVVRANALAADPDWPKAIARVGKQTKNIFNDALFGIFADTVAAQKALLAGDFNDPANPANPANTAPGKRLYFLQGFLPFLREQLSQRLIISTCAAAAGLESEATGALLNDMLVAGPASDPAMRTLESIKNRPAAPGVWNGYLIPSANAAFVFVAIGNTAPDPIVIDGQKIPFTVQQEDPSNVWSTDPAKPIKLKSGKLYALQVTDRPADALLWRTAGSATTKIPTSALLPDYSSQGASEVLVKLFKAALLINGFDLSVDEMAWWQGHPTDFDGFDFNKPTLQHWKRLRAYTALRDSLPRTDTALIDLFKWAGAPDDPKKLSAMIAAATTWKEQTIAQLIAPSATDASSHFDLDHPEDFRNEIHLVQLRDAIAIADKIGVDVDRLFDWAKPGTRFWPCHLIAEDVRKALRARFNEDDWEQVVKPLHDQLREHQKRALIDYLLVQPDLIDWGVVDADSLFEFFLIDVQMDACMETSRIKQAISSVQLFIQRCLLGLEELKDAGGNEIGVANNMLDRTRWDWMQRYRVWEANRKVFLYPENWLVAELRDDKTPFFEELESELLQKDISAQTIEDTLKSYMFKVDEVANLKVAGLFLDTSGQRLHVFGRTRNAPYFFYYRYLALDEKNWYPWEKMQVDVPSYDAEGNAQILVSGSYVIPAVWNRRLLVFFPQFQRKTNPKSTEGQNTYQGVGGQTVDSSKPDEFWEIKLAWSEYRNGKWTQKQVSADAVYSIDPDQKVPFPGQIEHYNFVPRIVSGASGHVVIEITFSGGRPFGQFVFTGSQLVKDTAIPKVLAVNNTEFQVYPTSKTIHSFQAAGSSAPGLMGETTEPFFVMADDHVDGHVGGAVLKFSHRFAHELLGDLSATGIQTLYDYYLNKVTDTAEAFGAYQNNGKTSYHELKTAYAIYNWEAAFHITMLFADRLVKAGQFEQALDMCHYVLSPFAAGAPNDPKRFWQFWPFRQIDAENVLLDLFLSLKPGQPNTAINEWRNKPFQPHVVARSRPAAYMMWVAMTYIETLIAWGDYLFSQDTIETINQATQLYVLAAHVYGPRGTKIPKRGKVQPQTYNGLLDKWDAFGNAMVELELAFPFSNQTTLPIGVSNGVVGLPNVFGFATTLYFCIPDNPNLTHLRDVIDDRLFKIRHCENIEGVFRQLPLFEPPIDPGLLVQAAAQGLNLSSVLNDLNSPLPNYRFTLLLQKALEMCNELKSLGTAFLSAKEKGDAEALARLHAAHDSSIQNLVMEVRKRQLDEAQASLDSLQASRRSAVYRLQHHLKLIGEDLSKVPDENTDFSELADTIEQPVDDSGLKLISYEKEELDKASDAHDWQFASNAVQTLSAIFHALPDAVITAAPLGVGLQAKLGGSHFGNASTAAAKVLDIVSSVMAFQSARASRKAGFLRQLQDRTLQANTAGYEIKTLDRQMTAQNVRISIANQEITNQQKQIENAQAVEDFLRSKYSSQELYQWTEGQLQGLYYQAYTLAYDLAKRAEKAFRYERGLATSQFIQFGYWDPAHDGLLAGERLYVGLKQLEAAHQEKRGYDFEITRNISLLQLNPLALMSLRENGQCELEIPEVLFDMGYPGHYLRRIRSVAVTFACLTGPATSINCTLRLLENKFRMSPLVSGKGDYAEHTDEIDERFATTRVPITAIAVTSGREDTGTFELSFHEERYLPFEGAGAISKWRIELPAKFREFDYESITDVVMQLRYTSVDGGDALRTAAETALEAYLKSVEDLSREQGLFAFFDITHDFGNAWYKANQLAPGATERVVALDKLYERLPAYTRRTPANKVVATDVYVVTSAALPSGTLTVVQGADDVPLGDGSLALGTMKSFVAEELSVPMSSWQLKIADTTTKIEQLWLVARYTLESI